MNYAVTREDYSKILDLYNLVIEINNNSKLTIEDKHDTIFSELIGCELIRTLRRYNKVNIMDDDEEHEIGQLLTCTKNFLDKAIVVTRRNNDFGLLAINGNEKNI